MDALQFGNAEQDDLWYYLTEVAHSRRTLDSSLHLKTMMETWTDKPGYPVLNVTLLDSGNFSLAQTRFLAEDILEDGCEDESRYGRDNLLLCTSMCLSLSDKSISTFSSLGLPKGSMMTFACALKSIRVGKDN